MAKNALDGGGDTIVLPAGTYTYSHIFQIHDPVTISGQGAPGETVIDAAGQAGAFVVGPIASPVTLANLTVRGVNDGTAIVSNGVSPLVLSNVVVRDNVGAPDAFGGGLVVDSGSASIRGSVFSGNRVAGTGGGGAVAVLSGSDVTIQDSELSGNSADPNVGHGGALTVEGSGKLTMTRSLVSANVAQRGAGFAMASTGGGSATISDSTFDGNRAASGFGSAVEAITSFSTSTVLEGDTLIDNPRGGSGAGVTVNGNGGHVTLQNSVVLDPRGTACPTASDAVSRGHNVIGDASCGFTGAGDRQGVDPLLGPLAANGGPTLTALPLTGSPLIDAADAAACSATDQRGVARPQGAGCDIGAVEVAVPLVPPPGGGGPGPGPGPKPVPQGIRISKLHVAPHTVVTKATVTWTASKASKVKFTVKVKRHNHWVAVKKASFTVKGKAGKRNRHGIPSKLLQRLHTGGYRLEAVALAKPALKPVHTTFRYAPSTNGK